MKSVLMSIKPEWCKLIADGKKTIEVRKSRPKLETPFKVYIYCTNGGGNLVLGDRFDGYGFTTEYTITRGISREKAEKIWGVLNGKVIGEFVCDHIKRVVTYTPGGIEMIDRVATLEACLTIAEISKYAHGKDVFAWYITDLVIYDKPKELSEFLKEGDCEGGIKCKTCPYSEKGNEAAGLEDDCIAPFDTTTRIPITRPPQSWCYIEDGADL